MDSLSSSEYRVDEIRKIQRACTRRAIGKDPETALAKLAKQRQKLVLKGFEGQLTSTESQALGLLEWQIDRIEDAFYGEHLDMLQNVVLPNAMNAAGVVSEAV